MSPRERRFKGGSDVTSCRSCKAPIVWMQTWRGKRMPVDAVPVDDGDLYIEAGIVRHIVPGADIDPSVDRYTSHFATCPEADEWRKEREHQ